MRNTAEVIGGNPNAIWLQSISGVSTLVAFYDIHVRKEEVLFYSSVSNTTRDYSYNNNYYVITKLTV
jgi:hypothetical protein